MIHNQGKTNTRRPSRLHPNRTPKKVCLWCEGSGELYNGAPSPETAVPCEYCDGTGRTK